MYCLELSLMTAEADKAALRPGFRIWIQTVHEIVDSVDESGSKVDPVHEDGDSVDDLWRRD